MSSTGESMARQRIEIISAVYRGRKGYEGMINGINAPEFVKKDGIFTGTRRDQVHLELFKARAAKATNEQEIIEAYREVFPGDAKADKRKMQNEYATDNLHRKRETSELLAGILG